MKRIWRILELTGIERGPGDGIHFRLTRRFFVIMAGLAVSSLLGLGGLSIYSTSPSFCHSCHIMEPYYQGWKHSKHKNVPCVECHYPPESPRSHLWRKFQAMSQVVKYVTRTYSSKPFAEVDDKSCLRSGCHSSRLLEGRLVTPRGIRFDHRPHLTQVRRGRQLRCVSCHSQVVVGKHIEVTYDTCYLCHFRDMAQGRSTEPIGGCLGCHDLPAKSFRLGNMTYNHKDFVTKRGISCQNCHLGVIQGKGEVPRDRCLTCHNQPEKIARFAEDAFIHENHVTKHNIACFHCHEELRHGFREAPAIPPPATAEAIPKAVPATASASHVRTVNFDCSFCHDRLHTGQLELYAGKVAGLGLPEIPSPMFVARVDCVGCHYAEKAGPAAEFRGQTHRASEKACEKCHGERFAGILDETLSELKTTLDRGRAKLGAARAALAAAGLDEPERRRLGGRLDAADRWQRLVESGKGVHNVYLASVALRRADTAVSAVGEAAGAKLEDLSGLPLLSGGFCATMCHPRIGVKVPPDTVRAFGKEMPHGMHASQNGCVTCHEIGGHKMVPLKPGVRKTVCAGCHPE
ncbi:MAG: cytochrome c3 family protein [Candidatus Coatesbacteria bacterium]